MKRVMWQFAGADGINWGERNNKNLIKKKIESVIKDNVFKCYK